MAIDDQLLYVLKLLGYDARWLDFELLDPNLALEQYKLYQAGDDPHTEHYRYAAFRAILTQQASLDDGVLGHYLTLVAIEPDRSMAQAALVELAAWYGLSDDQLAFLRVHPMCQDGLVQKVITRSQLLRELAAYGPTAPIFDRCIESGDSWLHTALVERADLSQSQLAILAERGGSRAARNIAKQKLRRNSAGLKQDA